MTDTPTKRVRKRIEPETDDGSRMQATDSDTLAQPISPENRHVVRAGPHSWEGNDPPIDPELHRKHIEPWLSALLQTEHLNLLLGNGFTTSVAVLAEASAISMEAFPFECDLADAVKSAAKDSAKSCGRGDPNIEDQIRAAREMITGLEIMAKGSGTRNVAAKARKLFPRWQGALDNCLKELLRAVLTTERGIEAAVGVSGKRANRIRQLLGSFLLTFASRTSSRERLHIFTTNYDRLIEYGCDLLGLRVLDRFVGRLQPVFRASRLGIDLHYNPPGIRGEPRYLEGVVRFTKLHGSIDWRQGESRSGSPRIIQSALPFGAAENHPDLPDHPIEGLIIYPNPAKDIETLEYPYAELFRDFAGAVCQPNAVLFTYGYGFGDDHINRIIRDMLTIPSSHLVIISFGGASGRIARFCEEAGRDDQITLLVGDHFGDFTTLVEKYLPKPAIDRTTWRMVELLNRRMLHGGQEQEDLKDDEDPGDSE